MVIDFNLINTFCIQFKFKFMFFVIFISSFWINEDVRQFIMCFCKTDEGRHQTSLLGLRLKRTVAVYIAPLEGCTWRWINNKSMDLTRFRKSFCHVKELIVM